MAIMVAMNAHIISKAKPMNGRSKSLRTISLENFTASFQMASSSLGREVTTEQGSWNGSNSPN